MLPAAVLLALHATPVVVFPPVTEAKDAPLALVIQDRASALIARSGGYHLMHVKQVISMSSRHAVPLDTLADPNAARTGAELWRASVGGPVDSGPMSYEVNGRQYVAVSAGNVLFTYALRQTAR